MEDEIKKSHIEAMTDYIMKHCLWQFHSRAWDRRNQNQGILSKTAQILCGERVELETPADRCYWVDAVILAEEFCQLFPWLKTDDKDHIKEVMKGLHEKMDFLTIDGSLNLELNDQHY